MRVSNRDQLPTIHPQLRGHASTRSMAAQVPHARPMHAPSTPHVMYVLTHAHDPSPTCSRTVTKLTLKPWSGLTHTCSPPREFEPPPNTVHARATYGCHTDMMCHLRTKLNRTLDLRAPPASHSYLQMQVQRAPGLPREAHTTVRATACVGGEYRVAGNSSQASAL
jgi:hypothetical protein